MKVIRLPQAKCYDELQRPHIPEKCILLYHKPFAVLCHRDALLLDLDGTIVKKKWISLYIFIALRNITHTRWYEGTTYPILAINRN